MKVGENVFISSGLKYESKADHRYEGLSADILRDRIVLSDHVFIISAYYDVAFVRNLFVKKVPLKSLTSAPLTTSGRGRSGRQNAGNFNNALFQRIDRPRR